MAEYIERKKLEEAFDNADPDVCESDLDGHSDWGFGRENVRDVIRGVPAADVVPVVRCQDCIYAVPLDRNCELNQTAYLHCNLWRGEETKNVWHKYKKYYKDYSLVDRDGFCSSGERIDNETD